MAKRVTYTQTGGISLNVFLHPEHKEMMKAKHDDDAGMSEVELMIKVLIQFY